MILDEIKENEVDRFRPQQGLTIMNHYRKRYHLYINCFRPQQGLTIMNSIKWLEQCQEEHRVSVPNRG